MTFKAQCDTEKEFSIWIRCNPLKSPDSAKEKQGNAGFGAFITRTENIRQNCGEASRIKGERQPGALPIARQLILAGLALYWLLLPHWKATQRTVQDEPQ